MTHVVYLGEMKDTYKDLTTMPEGKVSRGSLKE
jgi:hypothetical protein